MDKYLIILLLIIYIIWIIWILSTEFRQDRNIKNTLSNRNIFNFEIKYKGKIKKIKIKVVEEYRNKMHEITCFEIDGNTYNGHTYIKDIIINECHVAKIIDSSFDYKKHIYINNKYDINKAMLSKICKAYNKEYLKQLFHEIKIKESIF